MSTRLADEGMTYATKKSTILFYRRSMLDPAIWQSIRTCMEIAMSNTYVAPALCTPDHHINPRDDTQLPVVMVVDDQQQVLDIARRLIERLGYHVLAESNPHAALARYAIEHAQIACVLLDLAMRPINGLELFALMLKINPHVCAILSSGSHQPDIVEHYLDLGLAGFLPKPYHMNDLRKMLADVLDRK
jgi:CheY-like chemotaxis protein